MMIAAYALPHIFHASLTNSKIQGRFRHSFWNEVYETVLAWYIMGPVLKTLVNPKSGSFNVTDKGGVIHRTHFDWKLARPYIVLLTLNVAGMVFGVWQLINGGQAALTTILINMAWTIYNLIISCASMAVASETRQVRSEPRVAAKLRARVELTDGRIIECLTQDFSQSGVGMRFPKDVVIAKGEKINITLFRNQKEQVFPAIVMFNRENFFGTQFDSLSLRQQSDLVGLTFSRADIWASTWGGGRVDTPLVALREVSLIGMRGVRALFTAALLELCGLWSARRRPAQKFASDMGKQ